MGCLIFLTNSLDSVFNLRIQWGQGPWNQSQKMSKLLPWDTNGGSQLVRFGDTSGRKQARHGKEVAHRVSFTREELRILLNLYGRNVSGGIWCDYAMDFLSDRALFSIYRSNSSHALYTVEKEPALRKKQGQYLVRNRQGKVLKRGAVLAQVLRVLDPGFVIVK